MSLDDIIKVIKNIYMKYNFNLSRVHRLPLYAFKFDIVIIAINFAKILGFS